jgi:hypothetical protein
MIKPLTGDVFITIDGNDIDPMEMATILNWCIKKVISSSMVSSLQ